MKKRLLFILTLLISTSLFAQKMKEKIDHYIQEYVQDKDFNGTALVVKDKKIILKKGYGLRNIEEGLRNNIDGIYQVASLTKQFTAAVIMQLEKEGKLTLLDKLSKYFPEYPDGKKIEISHLLNHTSGLYDFINDPELLKKNVSIPSQKEELLSMFMKSQLKSEPGEKYRYSNTGYMLLGYIIESVTQTSFEQNVRQRILQPLKMTQSGFDFINLKNINKEKGYTSIKDPAPVSSIIVDSTISYASGALYSTVDDLYKWERAIYTEKILSQHTWKTVFTPYKNKYGYGWGIDTFYSKEVLGHGGNIPGFSSYILRVPQDKVVIILLDNSSSAALAKMAKSIVAILYEQPYEAFNKKVTKEMDATELQKFVGVYETSPLLSITIALEGNQLKASPTGRGFYDIFYESDKVFKLKVIDAKIEFISDDTGGVTELIFHQGAQKTRGKKIK
jgi:CubicO group peptidase (beta-lactamase class C family)